MNTINWIVAKIVWMMILLVCLIGACLLLGGAAVLQSTDSLPMGLAFLGGVLISVVPLVEWSAHRHAKAAADPAAAFVLTYSNFSLIVMSCAFLTFASACAIPLAAGFEDSSGRWWAWLGMIVFGATAVGVPLQKRLVSLTLSPAGLDFSLFKSGPIAWHDIESADISRMFRSKSVVLRLRNEQEYLWRRLTPMKKWLGWRIPDASFDVSSEWLMKAIQLRIDRFGKTRQTLSPTVQRQGTH